MFALRNTRTTWIGYALLLGFLAAVAYGSLAAQALDTDDFEYLRDAAAAQQLLNPTLGLVDKSVQKGVLKKNTASRMKSRLTVLAKTLTAKAG